MLASCARSRQLRGSSGLLAPVGDPGGALFPSWGPVGSKAGSMEVVGFYATARNSWEVHRDWYKGLGDKRTVQYGQGEPRQGTKHRGELPGHQFHQL